VRPAAPPAAAGAAAPASARNAAVTEDGRWAPDGDGDGESRSGEDGGDGDGENRCDEDGGDGDGESRCGEVPPAAPSAAAAARCGPRPLRPLSVKTPPCVFTDSDWASIVEPCAKCAWQFLVHREFMAREVQDFEVVRVCIKKTKTAVMDSRTAHAGTEPRSRAGISARGVGCLPMRAGTRRDALPFGCLAPVHPQLGSERP